MERALRIASVGSGKVSPTRAPVDAACSTLLADYCLKSNVGDPESISAGEPFTIDGVDFELSSVAYQKMLLVQADFGMAPETGERACYRELLEMNATSTDEFGRIMALCPDTEAVLCRARLSLKDQDADALDRCIRSMAKAAAAWRLRSWSEHADTVVSKPGRASNGVKSNPNLTTFNYKNFVSLISAYCRSIGLDAAEKILDGAPLKVNGTLFALNYGDRGNVQLANLYCDLGPVPKDASEEFYSALLQANVLFRPETGHAMMISARTNRVLFGRDFCPKRTTPGELQYMMESMAEAARKWRETA